jgi:hypothetical protein
MSSKSFLNFLIYLCKTMDLKELNEKLRKLDLPEDQKESIFELIDLKTNYNMENAVNRLEASIGSLRSEINVLDHKLDTKFDSSRNEIGNMKWTVTLGITIATVVISVVIALVNFFMKK